MRRVLPPILFVLVLPVLVLAGCAAWNKPVEPPPAAPAFCTRSLGTVDCWSNPDALNSPPPHGVADGPRTLTPAQEINRTSRWPGL
jgi:hypothetical protein